LGEVYGGYITSLNLSWVKFTGVTLLNLSWVKFTGVTSLSLPWSPLTPPYLAKLIFFVVEYIMVSFDFFVVVTISHGMLNSEKNSGTPISRAWAFRVMEQESKFINVNSRSKDQLNNFFSFFLFFFPNVLPKRANRSQISV
jgi:hypothetical protein